MHVFPNPAVSEPGPYPRALGDVIGLNAHRDAARAIRSWPGYASTPLVALPSLARELSIRSIRVKDESGRFGLGSFKALGGAYGVERVLAGRADPSGITVTCASDGNHGRAVAWGAGRFGCRAVVYLPAHVTEARAEAIRSLSATVVRVEGEYDEAVARAEEDAARHGWTVVSDTSYEGYDRIPRWVMQGYTVMVAEAMDQLGDARPTHVFVQGGVGGLAAAALGHWWEVAGTDRPRFVVVEPEEAACLYETVREGRPAPARGSLETVMAGLSCRRVSPLAWSILEPGAHAFITVRDTGVHPAMRALGSGAWGATVEAGESGVAGLLGLVEAARDPGARELLGLNDTSEIIVFNTEGATDPGLYRRVLAGESGGS